MARGINWNSAGIIGKVYRIHHFRVGFAIVFFIKKLWIKKCESLILPPLPVYIFLIKKRKKLKKIWKNWFFKIKRKEGFLNFWWIYYYRYELHFFKIVNSRLSGIPTILDIYFFQLEKMGMYLEFNKRIYIK